QSRVGAGIAEGEPGADRGAGEGHDSNDVGRSRVNSGSSIGRAAAEAAGDSQHDDLQIEPQRPLVNVLNIVLDSPPHLVERVGFAAKSPDLCKARDTRPDLVAEVIARNQAAVLVVQGAWMRARTDDRHVSLQDVDELGQLVERGAA